VIDNPKATNVTGDFDSLSDDFCTAQKKAFGDDDTFTQKGGMKKMSDSLGNGMTLVMSLWDDANVHMLWLDSDYPTTADPTKAGVARGTCPTTSGNPADVRKASPGANVTFSDIRHGDIGSTYKHGPSPPTPTGDKYKCDDNKCTKSTDGKGLDLDICKQMCGSYFTQ
jgi:cellulose 1,4-beta-cellobiosidase